MQGRAEIIALQIVAFEIKLGKGMRSIDDSLNAACTGHFADSTHRSDLPREIYLMRDQDQFCFRCDCPFVSGRDIVYIFWSNRNFDQIEFQTLAHLALAKRGQHTPIILRGGQYLIARIEIQTHQ